MSDQSTAHPDPAGLVHDGKALSVRVNLRPIEPSAQPIYSNFTGVQHGAGVVFVDFGFLEPSALNNLAKAAQSGTNAPDTIGGRLVCRTALSRDAAASLAQQLMQVLQRSAQAQSRAPAKASPATND
jgi:hypothetical protein